MMGVITVEEAKLTSGLVEVYLRALREYIKKNFSFEEIIDVNILNFISEEMFFDYIMDFFDKDETIEEVCAHLFEAYSKEKRNFELFGFFGCNFEPYRKASALALTLKFIKYGCTIIPEIGDKQSIFSKTSVLEIIKLDTDFNPVNWRFISRKQFEYKIVFSFKLDYFRGVCPVTGLRVRNIFNLRRQEKYTPLFILDERSFEASIDNLINNFVKPSSKKDQGLLRFSRTYAHCAYVGSLADKYDVTYTDRFKGVYDSLKKLFEDKKEDYKDYEVIFAFEYHPSRAYAVVIEAKLFVFQKVEGVGYVLQELVTGEITNNLSNSVFFSKMIKKEKVVELINCLKEFFKARLSLEELEEVKASKPICYESEEKKEYRLIRNMANSVASSKTEAQKVDFIIFPQ